MGTLSRPNRAKSMFAKGLYNGRLYNNKCPCRLHVTFIDKDGDKHEFEVAAGDNLLDIAQANDIEMEGMAFLVRYSCAS